MGGSKKAMTRGEWLVGKQQPAQPNSCRLKNGLQDGDLYHGCLYDDAIGPGKAKIRFASPAP